MSQLLIDEFEDFFQKIQLRKKQSERIESAVDALSGYLIKAFEIDPSDIFVQGSLSTNTIVNPAPSLKDEGEYDVDIVVFSASIGDTPNDALEALENVLEDNGNYKDKIEKDDPKIPCVRLRYADENTARFHVDIVPAIKNEDGTIQVPRRGDGWEVSNPNEYAEWVLGLGERYRRTLMMLKRWRDEAKAPIKSVVLQVLTAECLGSTNDDATNVAETFRAMADFMDEQNGVPQLSNPVLEEEILTARWADTDYSKFKELVMEAADIAESALGEDEHDEAATLWQKILGEDFIFETDKEVSLGRTEASLGDISHAQPLVFPYRPLSGANVLIQAYFYKPWTKQVYMPRRHRFVTVILTKRRHEIKSGQLVKSGGHLDYFANVHGLKGRQYEIHWQVVNTGDEARRKDGLRGTFFVSKDTNNLKYNYEQTSYEGTHWIECFVVMDNVCVARSGRFYLNIEH